MLYLLLSAALAVAVAVGGCSCVHDCFCGCQVKNVLCNAPPRPPPFLQATVTVVAFVDGLILHMKVRARMRAQVL